MCDSDSKMIIMKYLHNLNYVDVLKKIRDNHSAIPIIFHNRDDIDTTWKFEGPNDYLEMKHIRNNLSYSDIATCYCECGGCMTWKYKHYNTNNFHNKNTYFSDSDTDTDSEDDITDTDTDTDSE